MRIWSLLAALCVTLVFAASAHGASLRANAVVEDSVIRLGDLFDDVGASGDLVVAQSPAPGRRATLDAVWLAQIARTHQIDWRPQSRFDRVVVERIGRLISTSEIVAGLSDALTAAGMPAGAEIELAIRNLEIAVALDLPPTVEVRNLTFERQSGRFSALLIVGGNNAGAKRMGVNGRIHRTATLPVLRRAMASGDIIRKEDIEMARVREELAQRDVVTDPQKLVGLTPRYRLRAGEPVREGDARPPIVIVRNSPVIIVLQAGNMTLTAQGRATEDGAKGEIIRVTNMQSKKVIEAVVAGPDTVTVALGSHRALN